MSGSMETIVEDDPENTVNSLAAYVTSKLSPFILAILPALIVRDQPNRAASASTCESDSSSEKILAYSSSAC
jgi:hypothetical protein